MPWDWRAGRRRRIEAFARGELPEVPHGTASTYQNYGCRCLPCSLANADRCRNDRIKRKKRAR